MKKNNKGITLVALIITIIVLLILATVSISLVINNGVLDKAQHGVDKYSEEEELEQIKLAVASAMLKGNGFLDTDNLNSELHERIDENENAEKNGTNWNYKGYLIDENGNVEKKDKLLPADYQQVEYLEGTDGINRPKINVINEKGINSKRIYVEAQVVFIPNNYAEKSNRSIIFSTGKYGKCMTSFYRQGYEYVAIYSGSAVQFPMKRYNDTIENKIASITSNYAKVGDIEISINYTNNSESIYDSFTIASGIGKFGYVNIYEIVEEDKRIIRHSLIPCVDKNNTPCMYDTLANKAYYNEGSGDYIAGPKI